mmetsp:Transcript_16777/g.24148  ORF Transcript_16777/g.24148 Transcript_16777/m.24148 type:complete len:88 (+) Transcript_16777:16-279(+)
MTLLLFYKFLKTMARGFFTGWKSFAAGNTSRGKASRRNGQLLDMPLKDPAGVTSLCSGDYGQASNDAVPVSLTCVLLYRLCICSNYR